MGNALDNMIEALRLEVAAIKKGGGTTTIELHGGERQRTSGGNTLYIFPLTEEINVRDDSPVRVVAGQRSVEGFVVSIKDGKITVALEEDIGSVITVARLIIDDSFLVERLKARLEEVRAGTVQFNRKLAEKLLTNSEPNVGVVDIPEVVINRGSHLNEEQKKAVQQCGGSDLLFLWGPPGTGKTLTLSVVVDLLYLKGKTILIVSNTNIAIDNALKFIGKRFERIPEFQEAAVLRYGPLIKDSPAEAYRQQVDIEEAVKRSGKPLMEKIGKIKNDLMSKEKDAQNIRNVIAAYDAFNSATTELGHKTKKRQVIEADIKGLNAEHENVRTQIRALEANLIRVNDMTAIRKFLLGLNEQKIQRQIAFLLTRQKSLDDSITYLRKQLAEVVNQLAEAKITLDEGVASIRHFPPEATCRHEWDNTEKTILKLKGELKTYEAELNSLRERLMRNCKVLAATVYRTYLKGQVERQFDVVIIDEASMLALPMVYYAAGMAREKIVITGDFRQLPAIIKSKEAFCEEWLKKDIFHKAGIADAIAQNQEPKTLVALKTQYRMNESICGIVNYHFYDGELKTYSENKSKRGSVKFLSESISPLHYIDTSELNPWAGFQLGTYSRYNLLHALITKKLYNHLVNKELGVITPYAAQNRLIARLLDEVTDNHGPKYAATVHRFQGDERETIIFDIPDSTGVYPSHFINPKKRDEDGARLLNVALSRAKYEYILIANFDYLHYRLRDSDFYITKILHYLKEHGEPIDPSMYCPIGPEEVINTYEVAHKTTLEVNPEDIESFNEGTFYPAFKQDCLKSKASIVIFSPFLTQFGASRWVDLFRGKAKQGVRIRIVTKPPWDKGGMFEKELEELIDGFRKLGIVVDLRANMHEKMAFVDEEILWHGSLNILSHRNTSESMLRFRSKPVCDLLARFCSTPQKGRDKTTIAYEKENPDCPKHNIPSIWKQSQKTGIWYECPKPGCEWKINSWEIGREAAIRANKTKRKVPDIGDKMICPKCGKPLRSKDGRFGRFLGCTGYPKCRYTRNLD